MSGASQHKRLVFIGGLHRSGTTPLARVLGEHPEVSGFSGTPAAAKEDEGQHLQSVYPPAREYGGAGRFAFDPRSHLTEDSPLANPQAAEQLRREWAGYWDADKPVLVEKSPPNLVMTRFLQSLFPEASFLIIVRHPVVVALSTQKWRRGQALATTVKHWVAAHSTARADLPMLERVHLLRYEDLVADAEGALAGVSDFLELSSPLDHTLFQASRSDSYLGRWDQLTASRLPWHRAAVSSIEAAFPPAEAFGYRLPDLRALDDLAPDLAARAGRP